MLVGTYKVEGDKLIVTVEEFKVGKNDGKEKIETARIKELTDDKLVLAGYEMKKKEKDELTFSKKK